MSDAFRIITDPDFNLADHATRGVLHDALLDEGRDREAALVAGPCGQSLVFIHDRLQPAWTTPEGYAMRVVRLEMGRVPGWEDWKRFLTIMDGSEGGFRNSLLFMAMDSYFGGNYRVHHACDLVISLARQLRWLCHNDAIERPTLRSLFTLLSSHLDSNTPSEPLEPPLFWNRINFAIFWGHLFASQSVRFLHMKDHPEIRYEIRSMPVLATSHAQDGDPEPFGDLGFYWVAHHDGAARRRVLRASDFDTLYASAQLAVQAIFRKARAGDSW